mmetsp:Transcript_37145/g.73091  ORF Transcript_37145/g.73091 Transcript_37145/m.73091 type:complete len:130 (+) Transcript_37145:122-511(+)
MHAETAFRHWDTMLDTMAATAAGPVPAIDLVIIIIITTTTRKTLASVRHGSCMQLDLHYFRECFSPSPALFCPLDLHAPEQGNLSECSLFASSLAFAFTFPLTFSHSLSHSEEVKKGKKAGRRKGQSGR